MANQLTFEQVNGHHGLMEEDFEPVKDLIAEVRIRENLVKAIFTWQNAFTIFRKLEKRLGLPQSKRDATVYLAIVSELRSSGYWLLECISRQHDGFNLRELGISVGALTACIQELEVADCAVFLSEDTETMERLERAFA
jgi:hypothetical protein